MGVPVREKTLPTVDQLRKVLVACSLREQLMVWMAIGLGFGQRDLAAVRVGQIDAKSYDLRRGKTGVERFGETPRLVWTLLQQCVNVDHRKAGDLLFTTRKGMPVVHGRVDAVQQWWNKLRAAIGETPESLAGFYVLRHLGATEFGSRPGCSISDMKRWLGHAASSRVADVYMKPVSPENRDVVEWVRRSLASSDWRPRRSRASVAPSTRRPQSRRH